MGFPMPGPLLQAGAGSTVPISTSSQSGDIDTVVGGFSLSANEAPDFLLPALVLGAVALAFMFMRRKR